MTHELKTWMPFFQSVWEGVRTFEVREDDRNYLPGDSLILKEYDSEKKIYTGREILADVPYVLSGGDFGIEEGYCILALNQGTMGRHDNRPAQVNARLQNS